MLKEEKRLLRRCIADKKKMYTNHELATYSTLLLSKLERHPLFAEAQTILMYYSLPDEVQTHDFIEKWSHSKNIILPVVKVTNSNYDIIQENRIFKKAVTI